MRRLIRTCVLGAVIAVGGGWVGLTSEASAGVCASGAVQNGVDLSTFNGTTTDFGLVAGSGVKFVYARAANGTTVDTTYLTNAAGARAAGLAFGSYEFFRPGQDPTAQADAFITDAQVQPGDLVPMVDVETADGQPPATVNSELTTWLNVIQQALGVRPLIFTSAGVWNVLDNNDTTFGVDGYPLWVSNLGVTCPTLPTGWTNWELWQYSDTGTVPGTSPSGSTDLNDFNGADVTTMTVAASQVAKPSNAVAPTVTGTAAVGQLLSCSPGTWSGIPSFGYEWLRDGSAIGGAVSAGYTVAAADSGHQLTCQVTATNVRGSSAASSSALTVPVPAALPGAPTAVTATAGNGRATVTFIAPAGHASPITGYIVTATPGGAHASGKSSPIAVTGLTNGSRYTFTVRAINPVGTGPPSAPSDPVTPGALAGRPPRISRPSLTGVAKRKPKLAFTLLAGVNAGAVKTVTVALPRGLSFARQHRRLVKGVRAKGVRTLTLGHGMLTIALSHAARTVRVTIALPALVATRALAAKAAHRRSGKLGFVFGVTAAGEPKARIRLKLRAR